MKNQYQKESLSPVVATLGLIVIIVFALLADNLM
jgi:hypothetical protein